MYLADRLHYTPAQVNEIPWSRRKRLINDHHDLEVYRMRKQEEASKRARVRRR